MSFGTMLVHTTNAWEDHPCPVLAEHWEDFSTDYDRFDDGYDFGAELSLSVDMCASYNNPELFSLSSIDDFALPALSCTSLIVDTQPERPKKRVRESSTAEGFPSKKIRTGESELSIVPPAMPMSDLSSKHSESLLLPSPEPPSAPSSPNDPASSPSCVSPKALFSPVTEYAPESSGFGFGDLLAFDDVYVPRRRTTRAQAKLLQPLTAPTKKQRNKLARDIAGLAADKLREIVIMVNPGVEQHGNIELEFDVAHVDDKLFHQLRDFVDSCAQEVTESSASFVRKHGLKQRSVGALIPPPASVVSSSGTASAASPKPFPAPSPSKSAKTNRKRPRKGKKAKFLAVQPAAPPVAVPRSLTKAEVEIFQCQQVLTLAQTESAEEDEFVDIGE